MKNFITCLLLIFAASCKEDDIVHECVGASYYYLDNLSNQSFFIEFTAPVLNSQIDTTKIINKELVLIGQDAIFGYIPLPTDTFSSFATYTLVNGRKNIIYRQDPVQNTL